MAIIETLSKFVLTSDIDKANHRKSSSLRKTTIYSFKFIYPKLVNLKSKNGFFNNFNSLAFIKIYMCANIIISELNFIYKYKRYLYKILGSSGMFTKLSCFGC